MLIRFLGTHNAQSKDSRFVSFLIDGILAVEAGSFTSELSFDEQKEIRAILLSHGHYDHIRDIPAFAFNCATDGVKHLPEVLASAETLRIIERHLINGVVFPEFSESDSYLGKPAIKLVPVASGEARLVSNYRITALPVSHDLGAVGFEIVSQDGVNLFYTGDTGPGLSGVWETISPTALMIDSTFPNRLRRVADETGHLCPATLGEELKEFNRIKGYLPRVVLVHLSPGFEGEISEEAKSMANELGVRINIPKEGSELNI